MDGRMPLAQTPNGTPGRREPGNGGISDAARGEIVFEEARFTGQDRVPVEYDWAGIKSGLPGRSNDEAHSLCSSSSFQNCASSCVSASSRRPPDETGMVQRISLGTCRRFRSSGVSPRDCGHGRHSRAADEGKQVSGMQPQTWIRALYRACGRQGLRLHFPFRPLG